MINFQQPAVSDSVNKKLISSVISIWRRKFYVNKNRTKQISVSLILREIKYCQGWVLWYVYDKIMCFFSEYSSAYRLILFPDGDSVFSWSCLCHIESLLRGTIADRQGIVHNDVARLVCHWWSIYFGPDKFFRKSYSLCTFHRPRKLYPFPAPWEKINGK